MVPLALLVSGFVAPSARPFVGQTAGRSVAATMRYTVAEERSESLKAAGVSAVTGSLMAAPVQAATLLSSHANTAQWEFCTIALAFQLALFGLVYRAVVRSDDNDMLKQGAVGAASLARALTSSEVASMTSLAGKSPHTMDLMLQLFVSLGESALAFGGAAAALEWAWNRGYGRRIDVSGLPNPITGFPLYHDEPPPMYYRDEFNGPPMYGPPQQRFMGGRFPTGGPTGGSNFQTRNADERRMQRSGGRFF